MKDLRRVARQYLWVVTTISVFVVVAIAVAAYILNQERFRWPWDNVMPSVRPQHPSFKDLICPSKYRTAGEDSCPSNLASASPFLDLSRSSRCSDVLVG